MVRSSSLPGARVVCWRPHPAKLTKMAKCSKEKSHVRWHVAIYWILNLFSGYEFIHFGWSHFDLFSEWIGFLVKGEWTHNYYGTT